MKQKCYSFSLFLLTAILSANIANAKVWRVNNTPGVHADFNNPATAAATAAVGDTLYFEGSASAYNFTLSKRLVIIGPGYFLAGSDANPGLQANPYAANFEITIDSSASGSRFVGLSGGFSMRNGPDDLSFTRCQISYISAANAGRIYTNWAIQQCYLGALNITSQLINWVFTNNIVVSGFTFSSENSLVRNNTFRFNVNISGAYFTNNIILGNTSGFVNSTVKHNISSGSNVLPAGNGNQNGIPLSSLIVGSGSADGYFRLATNSPALGAGETINGITPDVGAFGTATPYRLSGIPPIPTIYALSVPGSVPANATSIDVTFSTRSNN
ncbi:MAG TPA: hypothetical protein VMR70_03815 [Flavisolibacter sp.]|nr:hypothetical protein [Flavisolibacter sp.]